MTKWIIEKADEPLFFTGNPRARMLLYALIGSGVVTGIFLGQLIHLANYAKF